MLYDPAFVAEVYDSPKISLSDSNLSEDEIRQLLATDRRAWLTDPLRRRRSLRALTDEFKASTTIALAETRSIARLDAFFSSRHFHQCVKPGGSMALAFSEFLSDDIRAGKLTTTILPEVLRFETVRAKCRRESPEPPARAVEGEISDTTVLKLPSRTAVGSFNAATIPAIQAVEQYLFEVGLMPACVLADDAPRLEGLPTPSKEKVYLLFSPGAADTVVADIPRAEFLTLFEFRRPTAIRDAVAKAAKAGVPAQTAVDLVAGALEAGALVLSA